MLSPRAVQNYPDFAVSLEVNKKLLQHVIIVFFYLIFLFVFLYTSIFLTQILFPCTFLLFLPSDILNMFVEQK